MDLKRENGLDTKSSLLILHWLMSGSFYLVSENITYLVHSSQCPAWSTSLVKRGGEREGGRESERDEGREGGERERERERGGGG